MRKFPNDINIRQALTGVNVGGDLQALMLKQEQEELLKEQRKLEQAVSIGYLTVFLKVPVLQ